MYDNNTTQIILAIIGVIAVIVGGSLIAIRISKSRKTSTKQDNITVLGNGKVIGGDDNSIS